MAQKEPAVQFSKLYVVFYQPLLASKLLELVNDIGQLYAGWQTDIINDDCTIIGLKPFAVTLVTEACLVPRLPDSNHT